MNILTGYLSSTSGTAKVGGIDILENPYEAKKLIGFLPEQPPLYIDMKVDEYLNFIYELKKCKLNREKHLAEVCDGLLDYCEPRSISLSLPSLRADNFSMDIMSRLQKVRKGGLTFAPEAGTQRLRDAINKNVREEDLLQAFRLVNNYLDPGGLFLFDMNTVYACETLLADHTFAESREDCSFIWENYYDPDSMLNEYDLTLFLRKDAGTPGRADDRSREELSDGSLYQRYTETHLERAYPLEKVKELLERAGMEYITAFDGYSSEPCTDRSERMLILARERGKKL
jgi:hypothetical protein